MSTRIVTRSRARASIDEPVARQPTKQTTRVSKAVQARKAKADDRRKAAAEKRATRGRSLPDPHEDASGSDDDEPEEMNVQQGREPPEAPNAPTPEPPKAQPPTPEPPKTQPSPVSGQPTTPDQSLVRNGRFDEDELDTPRTWVPRTWVPLTPIPRTWVPLTPIPGTVAQGSCRPKPDLLLRTVPLFDPEKKGARKWLETFERAAQANGLDGNTIIIAFKYKLAKFAATWAEAQQLSTYEHLRTRFLAYFGSALRNERFRSVVGQRTQQPGEAPSAYYYALAALNAQASPGFNETELRDKFVGGLHPSLQPLAKTWFGELYDWGLHKRLDKLDSKAFKMDIIKRSNRFQPYASPSTDADAGQRNTGVRFKCHQPGHLKYNCPNVGQQATSKKRDNKQALCFNCEQPGHIQRNCPRNKSKSDESDQVTQQDLQQVVKELKKWVEILKGDKRSSD